MGLSPEEFYDLTPYEYAIKCQGFSEHEKMMIKYQSWLTGLAAGCAFGASKENPFPSFEEFAKEKAEEETEEDLFELAKEKGLEVPEGK